jgi:hypothetical protein
MTINPETAIGDLRREIRDYERRRRSWSEERQRKAWRSHLAHAAAIARLFGERNGWTSCRWFAPDRIGKTARAYSWNWERVPSLCTPGAILLDHDLYYRDAAPGRGRIRAAIVGQPYLSAQRDADACHLAQKFGLMLHIPPVPTASIWNPGWCVFWVFTAPGVEVQWLPEQMSGIT